MCTQMALERMIFYKYNNTPVGSWFVAVISLALSSFRLKNGSGSHAFSHYYLNKFAVFVYIQKKKNKRYYKEN